MHLRHRRAALRLFRVAALAGALALGRMDAAAQQPRDARPGVEAATQLREEAVRIRTRGAVLAATLVLPDGSGPHAAAVVVPGAGEGLIAPSHPLVRRLAREGTAVLVLGKRGVGESTGDWRRESFHQRALDVEEGLALLEARPDVDGRRMGVIGHSQGGWIGQIVAARNPGLRFLVLLAGPAQTVRDQIVTDERIHLERRGNPPEVVESRTRSLRRQLGLLSATAPVCRVLRAHYLCHVIRHDPMPVIERIRVPVLAAFAELDPMVPPEPNARLLAEGLRRAGNADVTVHVFAAANHDFRVAQTGLRDEYPHLREEYVPGFIDLVSGWVRERTAGRGAAGQAPGPPAGEPPVLGRVIGREGALWILRSCGDDFACRPPRGEEFRVSVQHPRAADLRVGRRAYVRGAAGRDAAGRSVILVTDAQGIDPKDDDPLP